MIEEKHCKKVDEFKEILKLAKSVCEQLPNYCNDYDIRNTHGILHVFFARNLRFLETAFDLILKMRYSEALVILRSVMETSMLARVFAVEPRKSQDWYDLQNKIDAETDSKKKEKLIREKNREFSSRVIRGKLGSKSPSLKKQFDGIYGVLSGVAHPPMPTYGEFIQKTQTETRVGTNPIYFEKLFGNCYNGAVWLLAMSTKYLEEPIQRKAIDLSDSEFKNNLYELSIKLDKLLKIAKDYSEQLWEDKTRLYPLNVQSSQNVKRPAAAINIKKHPTSQ